jgi:hypothetical protein
MIHHLYSFLLAVWVETISTTHFNPDITSMKGIFLELLCNHYIKVCVFTKINWVTDILSSMQIPPI